MDRERLLDAAPTSQQLLGEPYHRRKELAEEYVTAVLDVLEANKHEPDTWEALHLNLAIGDIVMMKYVLSIDETMCALTPPEERGEIHGERMRRRSVPDLRRFLRHVAGIATVHT